jgi:hypothetical protein
MAWIKRNLYFVIIVVVALGVTGYCGYLLYSALSANADASGEYASAKSGLEELQHKPVYPSPENIQAAEADAVRVRAFMAEFRKPFTSLPVPPKLDDREFNFYLQKSIQRFALEATNAGVGTPPDYAFSFSQQITKINHPAECIAGWMQELEEINAILHLLYTSKINYLEKIKRPPICSDDAGGDDYIQFTTNVNSLGSISPYMVSFRAFSSEIANVLAGVATSSNCFILKGVYVSPSQVPLPVLAQEQPAAQPTPQYFRPMPQADLSNPFMPNGGRPTRDNREFRERRPYMPPAQAAATPVVPAGPETILMETPLFVTLYIDVLKLKTPEPPAKEVKPRRGGR